MKVWRYLETTRKYFRIERKDISFLKFILEAYDGVALMRTVDPEDGIVAIHIAAGCEAVVEMILQDLKREIMIEAATVLETMDNYLIS
ncbi:DUF4911 domain-containing protein [Thermodesulfobacteriota bacterium]